jgi:hypothetical protein
MRNIEALRPPQKNIIPQVEQNQPENLKSFTGPAKQLEGFANHRMFSKTGTPAPSADDDYAAQQARQLEEDRKFLEQLRAAEAERRARESQNQNNQGNNSGASGTAT